MTATPVHLLIFEPSWRRLETRIRELIPTVRATLMNEQGVLSLDGKPVAFETAEPNVAWPNLDVFAWPGRRDYFRALLKIGSLRWVQSAAAGVDDAVFGKLAAKGVTLTNSDTQAPAMADYILGAVLDFYQRHDERRQLQAAAQWERMPFRELADTTWLIVGFGHIGHETARRAHGFGATIIGVRREPRADEFARSVVGPERIRELLPTADVVVLASGLNDATRGLANREFFARMKPDSVFVNIGRGGLVDEAALLEALQRGTPARAVLDVFQTEPLPPDNPLWKHPRVRMSAHTSALGSGNDRRGDALFLDNLQRFANGAPLRNVVKAIDLPKI